MARDLSRYSVADVRKLLAEGPLTAQLLNGLQRDRRAGVRALHGPARRRFERERSERLRLDAMRNFERVLWRQGVARIAGLDEAGMGPLAGPVVAGAVVFPPDVEIHGIDDSKKLDAPTRTRLAEEIAKHAAVAVGVAEVEEIDALNIYQASLVAMRRALESLPEEPEHVLVDAHAVPDVTLPQNTFQKGDGINYSIAAASIIAKTHRDALMEELDREHPGYGLARHKGYATKEHQDAIRRLGPSPIHRRSFGFIRELCGEYSDLFYALQRQVAEARAAEELERCGEALDAARESLRDEEHRKLRLSLTRRWKAL
ncbi:MAG: ribonuclease HII [Myxococcota bacterium]|nr:ribonuclease HII [Myxococcota bacterium]